MPTKRRRLTRGRAVLTLDSLDLGAVFSLSAGWSPSRFRAGSLSPWRTWDDFLSTYGQVRAEYLEHGAFGAPEDRSTAFAEWLWQQTGGNPARVAALEREGDRLTELDRRQYPAMVINGVWALWNARHGS